ncbi:MAG: hypothetical protein EOO46_22495 [Flavobacterium sp.]|nr:MAG: hypothetical protein EOO46_22495 [Flavobacterium sp.]
MEEDFKNIKNKYRTGDSIFGKQNRQLQYALNDIDERISKIEERYLQTDKKTSTTRAQQIVFLKHLGLLEKLDSFNIATNKKAKLLAIILNASAENIEKDLSAINKAESHLMASRNYNPVVSAFRDAGLTALAEETDKILDSLIAKEK